MPETPQTPTKVVLVVDAHHELPFATHRARTADQAILMLTALRRSGGVDELWLDHTLGSDYGAKQMPTTEALVSWLGEQAYYGRTYPITGFVAVHAMNAYHAESMIKQLSRWYPGQVRRVPYHEIRREIDRFDGPANEDAEQDVA